MLFRPPVLSLLLLSLGGPANVLSQGAPVAAAEEAAIKKIGENRYRLGEIQFDAKTREVTLPVTVNMREGGPIEYLLVHENGKVHESIFTTAVPPTQLQIVMKLLRFNAGKGDVFNRLLAPENLEKEGGTKEERGDAVRFLFQQPGGEALLIHELVIDGQSAEAMTAGDWIYTGSEIQEGAFMAEAEGSIIAIYLDHLALFNMTREGADDDDRWGTRTSLIPEIGTKGTLLIQPSNQPVR